MTHICIIMILLAWGIAGLFDKKAVETNSNRDVFIAFHLFNFPLLAVLLVAAFFGQPWTFTGGMWFWQALAAAGGVLAVVFYLAAMSKSEASYVLGITAGYPVVSQLFGAALLGEPLTLGRLVGAALVAIGVALIGTSITRSKQSLPRKELIVVLIYLVIATVLWAAVGIFEKKAVLYGGALEAYFAETAWEVLFAGLAVLLFLRQGHQIRLNNSRIWKLSWTSALCIAIGNYLLLVVMVTEAANYAIVITACYPLVMYICAIKFLGEQVNNYRLAGIVLVICGGVLTELIQMLSHA